MYYDGAYGPFGEPYAQSGTTDLNFTGMNQDTASNVYDFPAREYGIQGRWPSPDPAGLAAVNPMDPQTWNRYAYVRNSPLGIIDPLGLCGGADTAIRDSSGNIIGVHGDPPCPPPPEDDNAIIEWMMQNVSDAWGNPFVPAPTVPHGGNTSGSTAANNGFTLGIRAPGQTWSQCMAANANTYSIGGATELTVNVATGTNSNISQTTSIVTGNGITGLIFEGPGAGDFLSAAGSGAGSALTYGRRTSNIMSLNLAGSGGLPQALGSTGAQGFFQTAGKWLNLGLDEAEKFAVDAGLAGAESINCAIHR